MRFHIGQDVYIGWSPNVTPDGKRYLCTVGEVFDGPFPPYHRFRATKCVCSERSWVIAAAGGKAVIAESLIFPFEDPDGATETRAVSINYRADILPPPSAPVGVTGSLQFRSANHRAVRGPGARELHIDFDDFIEIAKGNRLQ